MRCADRLRFHRQLRFPRVRLTVRDWALILGILLASNGAGADLGFGQVLQPGKESNVVRGTVVNAVTHEPVARALVHTADNRYATLTDGEGHFEFTFSRTGDEGGNGAFFSTGNPGAPGRLMARKPGFLDDSGQRGAIAPLPGKEATISLTPEGVIQGRVSFSATEPASGVTVELVFRQVMDGMPRWMPRNPERTNSNGEFRFFDLQPGTYKLLTREWMDNDPITATPGGQLYGFPPVYYPGAADFASASAIPLAAGQTFHADLSLLRQPYYPVKIPVATEDGGLHGMSVAVSLLGQHGPGYSLGYDPQKHTIEGVLPNGKYLVEGSIFSQQSSTGNVNLSVAGGPAEGPAMVLAPANLIPVNVKEEFTSSDGPRSGSWSDGKHTFALRGPRLDISVSADPVDEFAQRSGASIRQPTGPNDDSLVLENLPPGRYWLRLHASHGYVASASLGGVDLLHEPLVVVPGASTPIEITMRDDDAALEGNLLGLSASAGAATTGAHIYCIPLPDSPGQFLDIAPHPDGSFDYRMVAPGAYRVIAFASPQPELAYRDSEAMKLYETKGQVVQFAPGQKVTIQLAVVSGTD